MSRKHNLLESDSETELQNDEDSDMDDEDDVDSYIEDLVDDYREVISEMDSDENETQDSKDFCMDRDEEFILPGPVQSEVIHSVRGLNGSGSCRRSAWRGRRRIGRTRSKSSAAGLTNTNLSVLDEQNGWSYEEKKPLLEDPVFEEIFGVQLPKEVEKWSPLDCFELFFTSDFWNNIKRETNRYAAQCKTSQAGKCHPKFFVTKWTPVTKREMKKFFAVIFHMTLVKKESLDSYWSVDPFINTPFPAQMISRHRFRAIYGFLHLNDNSNYIPKGQEDYDVIFKIRPFFDMLVERSQNLYVPNENLTIDESTCGFRRQIHFRDYNEDETDKYGMKLYMLREAETGYVLKILPNVGDSKTVEQIIMYLMEGYLDKWHCVYLDRFFSDPTIMDLLWTRNTRSVGTVKTTGKGLPQCWRYQKLELNEMSFCHQGNLTACRWREKSDRIVCILTTKHGATCTEVTVMAKSPAIIKPDCVLDYKKNKYGVNVTDQEVVGHFLRRKSTKWWKKVFFHLVSRATVNAYVIYLKHNSNQKRILFSEFLRQCGNSLVEQAGFDAEADQIRSGIKPQVIVDQRLTGRHFVEQIPPTSTKAKPFRVCKVCADVGKARTGVRGRKETMLQCEVCKVALCAHPCFKKYHTQRDYTL